MARLTVYQKAERALRLLIGLRDPRVAAALAARGFGDRELREGWALLRRLSVETFEAAAPAPARPGRSRAELLARLDAWESTWFAIASATLGRRAPEVHGWLLRNLARGEGLAVVMTVTTFVARHERLGAPPAEGGLGALGEGGRAALAERGLTDAVIGEAKALLSELATASAPVVGSSEGGKARRDGYAEAERELWAWCLEWGAVVRAGVRDRSLLRRLGVPQGSGRDGDGDAA